MQQLDRKLDKKICNASSPTCVKTASFYTGLILHTGLHTEQRIFPPLPQAAHQSQLRLSMHNRSGKTIAENEVWELWAFLNYSNIVILLRAHWENALAFLLTQKRLAELCLHVRDMLSFAKLKKEPDHWRKKEYSRRTACFQPALQNQCEISWVFTSTK